MEQLDAVFRGAVVRIERYDDSAPGLRVIDLQLPQPLGVIAAHSIDRLGLHGAVDVVDHEVDFDSRAQTPVEEVGVAGAI